MDLWAELQATKEMLRNTEDEVAATQREKIRFLETLTKLAVTIIYHWSIYDFNNLLIDFDYNLSLIDIFYP